MGLEEQKNQVSVSPAGVYLSTCPVECHLPVCPLCALTNFCQCHPPTCVNSMASYGESFGGTTAPEDKVFGP